MAAAKRILSVLLALLLIMRCHASATAREAEFEGYRRVTSSGAWELYLKESTLGIIVRNAETGAVMYSVVDNAEDYKDNSYWKGFYQSGIVMEYMEGTVSKYKTADFITVPPKITVTDTGFGFHARVEYDEIGIGYSVEATLTDHILNIRLPREEMTETNPAQYAIAGFYVYPFMGYSHLADHTGFMLIPDGQGALITLRDFGGRYSSPYRSHVYGENIGMDFASNSETADLQRAQATENVIAPYYGMAHTDAQIGYIAVIRDGDVAAEICAYPNGASRMNFNWITARFALRDVYAWSAGENADSINRRTSKARECGIDISFRFAASQAASLTGLAMEYREALREACAFGKADQDREFDVWLDILCMETRSGVIGYAPLTLTDIADVADMFASLKGNEVQNISCALLGWQDGGCAGGQPVTDYHPIWGAKAMTDLYDVADELGYKLYLDVDMLKVCTAKNVFSGFSTLRRVDGQPYQVRTDGAVFGQYEYLAPHLLPERATMLAAQLADAEVPRLAVGGYPEIMTDYSYKNTYYSSTDTARSFSETTESLSENADTALRHANAYLWKYAEALLQMPADGSWYQYAEEMVPFLSIALSGQIPVYLEYANSRPNLNEYFLQLAETGARPSFLLMSADPELLLQTDSFQINAASYDQYEGLISEWYSALSSLHMITKGSAIVRWNKENGHTTVEYGNGVCVYVNHTKEEWIEQGVAIPSDGYVAIEKGER